MRLPDLPELRNAECPECGSTEALVPEQIYYRNVHGAFNSGLPDYFKLIIAEEPTCEDRHWGSPYQDEGLGRVPWPEVLELIDAFDEQQQEEKAHSRFIRENYVGGGRNWDYGFGDSSESKKPTPSRETVANALEVLKVRWAEIVGAELGPITRPLRFTGRRKRKLLVWADINGVPPWDSWTTLPTLLATRRRFTQFRAAVNGAIAPMQVDHIEFKSKVPASFPLSR